MAQPKTNILDHIVHLTPPGSLVETVEQFKSLGFNVLPGGVHAGGLTENALVVFSDGVYLELISFTYPVSHYPPGSAERTQRENHAWASKEPGWIDYAFLGNGSTTIRISDIINTRAKLDRSGTVYTQEVPGGRTRPDGQVLEWLISAPARDEERGTLPFFCGDVTPRKYRVPNETAHPSKALGIAHLRILTSPENIPVVSDRISCVCGKSPDRIADSGVLRWDLETVAVGGRSTLLFLDAPTDEHDYGSGSSIFEVGFHVQSIPSPGNETTTTPYGRIRWLVAPSINQA